MKKFLKIIGILFIIGLVCGIGVYLYVFHKPHRNIANEKPAFVMEASQLLSEFESEETLSYKKYGDKALQLSGTIADVSRKGNELSIIMEDASAGVSCSFETEYVQDNKTTLDKLSIGDKIKIKGKCDGYDMIMGIVLTRCSVVE